MIYLASWRRALPLTGQCVLILFGLAALYAFPPAYGRILLVPVTAHARAMLARVAVAQGARLVAAGRWRGSLLVEGDRGRLAQPLLERGILLLSTDAGGCEGGKG
ncbi:hypothetical protein Q4610_13450 [Sphingobium sp. HBC34]|uniref:Uncharacterized protein n=1 Tax=Sphingobium cyanobacteriorum TaxID=3063954 RepID=A0ABT8ZND5_9SPHN|nr:hypothetical protein [Sphingobium sp. HBC34]MDO7836052.1 hypothetical protein [Sphingobium sp. HBC34]